MNFYIQRHGGKHMRNNLVDFGDYFQQLPCSDAMKSFLQKEVKNVKKRKEDEFQKNLSEMGTLRTWKFVGKWISVIIGTIVRAFLFVNYFYTPLHPYALLLAEIYGYLSVFLVICTLILAHWFVFVSTTKNITSSNFADNLLILFLGYPFKTPLTVGRVTTSLLLLIYLIGLILNRYYLLSGILITLNALAFVLKILHKRMMRNKLNEIDRIYFTLQTT